MFPDPDPFQCDPHRTVIFIPKSADSAVPEALYPITGFANSVASSAIEYKAEGQVFGIGCKIFHDRRTRNSLWNPEFMDSRCDLLSFYNAPITIQHPYPERCFCIRIIQLYKEVSYEQTNDLRYIQHFISKSWSLFRAVLLLSAGKKGKGHWAHTLIPSCEDPHVWNRYLGSCRKHSCKNRPLLLAIRKGRPAPVSRYTASCLQATCWLRLSASSFGTADLEIPFYGLFGACSTMGESLSLGSTLCIDGRVRTIYPLCNFQPLSPAQKKNFGFPWDMEIKGPYLLPGQSPVPEPVYLDMQPAHHARYNNNTKHTP